MYNNQEIALKIKNAAKSQGISIKQLLEECNLNINYISQFSNGRDMTAMNLYTIANALGVSIDYLLGRTENPNAYKECITTGDVKGINVKGDTRVIINDTVSKETAELIEMIENLSLIERSKVVVMIDEMKKGTKA